MQDDGIVIENDLVVTDTDTSNEVDESTSPESSTGDDATRVEFSEEQQRVFNEAIGKKTFKMREIERELERERQRLAELEAKLPTNTRPELPTLPDRYAVSDDEWNQALNQYNQALMKQARYDAEQEHKRQAEAQAQQQKQAQQLQEVEQKVTSYRERSQALGVKPEELQQAGRVVGSYGIGDDLARFILDDDQGPLITKYLAGNISELENIASMTPVAAAVHIATKIKPKAAALKPKVSGAPDPLDPPGRATATQKRIGPEGATFE